MTYHAPLADMSFALKYGTSLLPALEEGLLGDLTMDDVEAVLAEAGRMAAEVHRAARPGRRPRWRDHQRRRRDHRAGLEGSV